MSLDTEALLEEVEGQLILPAPRYACYECAKEVGAGDEVHVWFERIGDTWKSFELYCADHSRHDTSIGGKAMTFVEYTANFLDGDVSHAVVEGTARAWEDFHDEPLESNDGWFNERSLVIDPDDLVEWT